MEAKGGMGVGLQLLALAAFQVGIEDEALLVGPLQQHHAQRRMPLGIDGGQGHGVGIVRLLLFGFGHPFVEMVDRVFGDIAHRCTRVQRSLLHSSPSPS